MQHDMVSEVGKWISAHRQPSNQPILILNGPISWLIRDNHPAIFPAEMASSMWFQPPSPHPRLRWRPPLKPCKYYNMCHSPTSWISKTIAVGTKTGCCSSRYGRTMKFHPSLSTTPQQHALRPSSRASSPQRWKSTVVSHSSRRQIRQISMLYSVKWVSFAKGWWMKHMSSISSTRKVKLPMRGYTCTMQVYSEWAENCKFGDLEQSLVKDWIVVGVWDPALHKHLLYEKKLTLQKCLEMACSFEDTSARLQSMSRAALSDRDVNFVHQVKGHCRPKPKPKHSPSSGANAALWKAGRPSGATSGRHDCDSRCYYCGRQNHPRKDCPASELVCHKCNWCGHDQVVCKSKSVREISE